MTHKIRIDLEIESDASDVDVLALVDEVLDVGRIQESINDHAQLCGPAAEVTSALCFPGEP